MPWRNAWPRRLERVSGSPGGAAVRFDTVLAEQVAQVIEFTVQSLVLRDEARPPGAGAQLLLQP